MSDGGRSQSNRRNAAFSTGPRTPEGRRRSAGNARKHGLTTADVAHADAAFIERLRRALCGSAELTDEVASAPAATSAGPALLAARAHAQVVRIRRAKAELYRVALLEAGVDLSENPMWIARGLEAEALRAAAPRLLTLDGYERKAISRRKSALRQLGWRHATADA